VSLPPPEEDVLRLQGSDVPIVFVDAHENTTGLPRVLGDDVAGGELATQHLLDLGHRHIGFVGDAFATLNVISGKIGPQLAPFGSDLERARESLARLERVEAGTVLPGHGQPWTKGVGEAIRLIRGGAPH
jgi:hypothetical protein